MSAVATEHCPASNRADGFGRRAVAPGADRSARRELAAGLLVLGLYLLVTHGLHTSVPAADAHGLTLLDAERWLHVDGERALNAELAPHAVLGALAAWEYAVTYLVTTFGVLVWLWLRHPDAYPWARNTLLVATLLALAVFAAWPVTPPRLLPGAGFVDVVARHRPLLSWGGRTVSAGADTRAGMPSLHVAWAVWVTLVTTRRDVRGGARRWAVGGTALAGLHLVATTYVVLATGNHFVLDVLGGGVAVALAATLHHLCEAGRRAVRSPASTGASHGAQVLTTAKKTPRTAIPRISAHGIPNPVSANPARWGSARS